VKSEKRVLIDSCAVQCGKKLFEKEGMRGDRYIELTSELDVKKVNKLPSKELEEEVHRTIQKEVKILLDNHLGQEEKREAV
jgi:uncharacterized metal-binding protein